MATRKTKRYSDGGDVLDRMMGTASSLSDGPGRDTNGPEPMRVDPFNPSDAAAMYDRMPSTMDNGFNNQIEEANDRIPRMRDDSMMDRVPRMRTPMDDAKPMPKPMRDNSIMDEMTNNKGRYKIPSGDFDTIKPVRGPANEGLPSMGPSNEGIGSIGIPKEGFPSMASGAREALQTATGAQAAKSVMQGMQKGGGLEGMAGALRGAMASMPSRGRDMGNRMGGMAKGGSVSSASSRGDGIAQRGKTRGKMC